MVELRRGVARGVLVWGAAQNWLPAASYAAVLPAAVPLLPADELAAATSDIGSAYTYALVWGLLNVSGFNFCKPGNLAQTVCSLFVAIVGISANAVIIGSVTTSLTRMNANANAERSRREAITSYLKGLKVPRDLLQVPPLPEEPRATPPDLTPSSDSAPSFPLLQRIHQYYDFIGGVSVREELLMPALPRALAFRLQMFKKRDRAPRHRPATTHRRLLRGTARV